MVLFNHIVEDCEKCKLILTEISEGEDRLGIIRSKLGFKERTMTYHVNHMIDQDIMFRRKQLMYATKFHLIMKKRIAPLIN